MKIDTLVKLSIIVMALSIGVSFFYYLVIFLPAKEEGKFAQKRRKQAAQEQEKKHNEAMLPACLQDASVFHQARWDERCFHSTPSKGEGCTLPSHLADGLKAYYEKTKNECFKKFPQK
ncbi:hypothetical protein ACFL38_05010 [Candidatus Omnitrophota bacterium]